MASVLPLIKNISLKNNHFTLSHNAGNYLDLSVFFIQENAKVKDDHGMVFYGAPSSPCGSVHILPSSIQFDLTSIPKGIVNLVLAATVDHGSVSQAPNFTLNTPEFTCPINTVNYQEDALILIEFYTHNACWHVRFISQGFTGGLAPLAEYFGVNVSGNEEPETPIAPASPFIQPLIEPEPSAAPSPRFTPQTFTSPASDTITSATAKAPTFQSVTAEQATSDVIDPETVLPHTTELSQVTVSPHEKEPETTPDELNDSKLTIPQQNPTPEEQYTAEPEALDINIDETPSEPMPLESPTPPHLTNGKLEINQNNKTVTIEKTDQITSTTSWKLGINFDMYALVMLRSGEVVTVSSARLLNAPPQPNYENGTVLHRGDSKGSGRLFGIFNSKSKVQTKQEIVDIRFNDDIIAIVPIIYSAKSNGSGAFYRYTVSLEINNNADTSIDIAAKNASSNDATHFCVPAIIYNKETVIEIEYLELYSSENSEHKPTLILNGDDSVSVIMDA